MSRIKKRDILRLIKENQSNENTLDTLGDCMEYYMVTNKGFEFEDSIHQNKITYENLKAICDELRPLGIKSTDFLNPSNIGFKNGALAFFDPGFDGDSDPNFKQNAISIDEDETEGLHQHYLSIVAERIFTYLKIVNVKPLGAGQFGLAYKGPQSVYKITTDLSEGKNATKLAGREFQYLANVFQSVPFTFRNAKYYLIEVEYIPTNPEKVRELYHSLDEELNYILEHKYNEQYEKAINEGRKETTSH